MDAEQEHPAVEVRPEALHCVSRGKELPYDRGLQLGPKRYPCFHCLQRPRDYWTRVHQPKESEE